MIGTIDYMSNDQSSRPSTDEMFASEVKSIRENLQEMNTYLKDLVQNTSGQSR